MRDRPRMSRMHRISNVRVYLVFHTLYHLVFKICVYRSTNGSRMMIRIGLAKFFGRFPPGILYMVESVDPKEERRQKRRALWAYIIGLFAVVFMWRSIWDWSEMYFSTTGSFIIGLILVGIVAFLQKDHVRNLFG